MAAENIFVLDREGLLEAKVIIAGDPDSRLLRMVETGAMPMGGPPLSAEDQAALRDWILAGAPGWTAAAPAPRPFLSEANIFRDPVRLHPAGGEVIFNLPNGLQAYFLANGQGQRLDAAPIEIVSDRHQPEDPVIRNGRSCMSCHYDGMRSFKDEVRPALREFDEVRFNLKKAFALYAPQETLDRAVHEDQTRFLKAAAEIGADVAQSPETEPIRGLARRFESDLDLAHAAAETGFAPEPFEQRLRASSRLIAMGFGPLLTPGGGVKRDTWERHFRELAAQLDIGEVAPGGAEIASRGPSKSPRSKTAPRHDVPPAVNVRDLFREPGWTPPDLRQDGKWSGPRK